MKNKHIALKVLKAILSIFALGVAMSSCAQVAQSGEDSWKEEVLLHDGQKIIVERSQTYGGRHEIGQPVPEREHTIRFTLPNSKTPISWTSEYGEELGRTNFNLMALHIKQGIPYLVAQPNLCLSYNKWGRPNPPYVYFKYDGKEWKRIELSEVPIDFKTINLIVATNVPQIRESTKGTGYVPYQEVMRINENLREPELKAILREPLSKQRIEVMCEELVPYKGSWVLPNDPIARKFIDSEIRRRASEKATN
jgi:hypothetical protein